VVHEDLENQPIFTLLEEKHGIPLAEATYRLRATSATQYVAERLQIPPGEPILLVERTTFTTGQEPIDYELLHYRGDAITFVTRLSRTAAGADR
jgi:GntR family transcriptional regulator